MATSMQDFGVIMAPADQEWWWYWGQTGEQVGQLLTQNKAMLTDISPYIDVDNTLKFAVIMAPVNQEWWWYPGLTGEQVTQLLTQNKAMLTDISPYIDVDNTLKFAVIMTAPVRSTWWWWGGLNSDEIIQKLNTNKARLIALTPYMTPTSGGINAAFVANDPSHELLVCSSSNGISWPTNTHLQVGTNSTSMVPSLAVFNGALWVAFVANDSSSKLLIATSADGVHWSDSFQADGWTSAVAPSLAVFNDKLWAACNTSTPFSQQPHELSLISSADGVTWSDTAMASSQSSYEAPSLAVFKDKLWMAFLGTDPSHLPKAPEPSRRLMICSTADGVTWSAASQVTGQTTSGPPSLAVFNNRLWVAFIANDPSNRLLICSTADGGTWSAASQVTGQTTGGDPSLAVFNYRLWVAFIANDPSKRLLICSSPNGSRWSGVSEMDQTSWGLSICGITTGQLRPLYKVLTVIYAPPGTNGGQSVAGQSMSWVDYGAGSTTGSTTSTTKSYTFGINVTASVGGDVGVVNLGASAQFTASKATQDSLAVQKSTSTSNDIKVFGPDHDGIDHAADMFVLWLNPLLNISIDSQNNITWELGVDGAQMDIVYVYVSWLQNPQSMPAGLATALAQRGLTTTDYANILNLDPFASGSTFIDPNRFLLLNQPPYDYEPPLDPNSQSPVNTHQQSNTTTQTASHQVSTQTGVSFEISAGIRAPFTASLSVSESFNWTDTSSQSTAKTQTQTAGLALGGPAYGYSGPIRIAVYWDTIYNSFMFAFAENSG